MKSNLQTAETLHVKLFDNPEEPEGFSSESGSYLKMFLGSLSSPGYRMQIWSDFHNKTRKKQKLCHKVEL